MHVRRKFAEIVNAAGGDAAAEGSGSVALEARRRIDEMFHVDSGFDGMAPATRKVKRISKLKPLMVSFEEWARVQIGLATPRGAHASAAIYSIVVTAKLNGLNQRAYVEWLLTEMPNDGELGEPGRIDRYLPWFDEVPQECRLSSEKAAEAAYMPDEPIVEIAAIEAALETT